MFAPIEDFALQNNVFKALQVILFHCKRQAKIAQTTLVTCSLELRCNLMELN